MDPISKAEKVATIAREYAHRRRHHIDHTGHTVHRLLDAVSALLGQRVTLEPKRVPAATPTDA
jgi:hypothetical protein